jgi:hypothetical protein
VDKQNNTYYLHNIKEAQANLTKLCGSGRKSTITTCNRPLLVALPVENFEALLETPDALKDPGAIKAAQAAKGKTAKYKALDLSDEKFGL